jgi:hypothetical protein
MHSINGVISKQIMISPLTFAENINVSEFIGIVIFQLSTFNMDVGTIPDLWTSASCTLWCFCQMINKVKYVTVTIPQHNNLDTDLIWLAKCVERSSPQGDWLGVVLIQGSCTLRNHSWVCLQRSRTGTLLYTFCLPIEFIHMTGIHMEVKDSRWYITIDCS